MTKHQPKGSPMTTAAEAVEIALRGIRLTEGEADRLHTLIAARTHHPSARERLNTHVDALRGKVDAVWLHLARRLIREALAEQAVDAVRAAESAYDAIDQGAGAEIVLAVRQAMLTDRPGD